MNNVITNTDESVWYDPAITLSHNCLWNMVLGERGDGKTFGCLKFAVQKFIKSGIQFMYVRRRDTDVDFCKDTLMDAITAENVFPGYAFKVIGDKIYCNDEIMGFCVALSLAYKLRSVAFPKCDLIIYDEFLIEDDESTYLRNEPLRILSLLETVGRMRDIKLIMLANYSTKSNPHFEHWQLYPRQGSVFTKDKNKPVLIHMYEGKAYKKKKATTALAKLVEGTVYGDYLLNNKALHDNSTFIEKLTGNTEYWFTIKFGGKDIGVRYQPQRGFIWFTENADPLSRTTYAFETADHAPNIMIIKGAKGNRQIKEMKMLIDRGYCRFENLGLKNTIFDLLHYI